MEKEKQERLLGVYGKTVRICDWVGNGGYEQRVVRWKEGGILRRLSLPPSERMGWCIRTVIYSPQPDESWRGEIDHGLL